MFAISSVSAGYGTDGSSTPTMTAERVPSRIVLPSTVGSLLSDVVQKRCVSTCRARRLRPIVLGVQQAAEHRLQPHDVEVVAVDDPCADLARLAEADHREADRGERADALQRLHALLKILDLRHGERGVLDAAAAGALPDVDQAARRG